MDPNVRRFNAAPLEYLTHEQMKEIHSAALEILEDLGTLVHQETAVELLKNAGANVRDGNRVFIPSALAEWAVRNAPSRITIYDRKGNPSMFLEGRNAYFGTGSDCPNILDSFTGERREFLYKDIADAVRLVDALQNIDFIMSMGLAADLEKKVQYQNKYATMLRNSTKPQVITAADQMTLNDIMDMAAAAVGSREELIRKPIFVLYDEPTSPLVHTQEAL